MSKFYTLRSIIISKIFGIILVALSIVILLSLISYSKNDSVFGNISSSLEISNFIGIYGSYISGFLLIMINNLSFFVPIFFLITGIKSLIGMKYNNFFFHIVIFIIGLSLFDLSLFFLKIPSGLIGKFLFDIIHGFINFNLYNQFIFWFFVIIIFLISLLFIAYGLTLKTSSILSFIKQVFKLIVYIFKPSKFLTKKIKSFTIKKFKTSENNIDRIKIKREPTIIKENYFKNNKKYNKTSSSSLNANNEYILPSLSLLKTPNEKNLNLKEIEKKNLKNAEKLQTVLKEYGVDGKITNFKTGPVITLFEFVPAPGIKTSKVVGLSEDIARAMSSTSTRISSQPGKSTIGIEIPNDFRQNVYLGDLLKDDGFIDQTKNLTLALGKNISGEKIYTDLEKMPHLLIAGTTGSGKSVGINSMILSLLFKFKPSECKFILIDPKMLELSIYENIPHLLSPVVTNPNKAVFALKWVVREMENRYRLMNSTNVKNIQSFNNKIDSALLSGRKLFRTVQTGVDKDTKQPIIEKKEIVLERMPLIVVVVDEMADLMMVAGKEVENLVQRLAQMARASGIHLITATQRPSVDVITGTIKANFPSRISFRVASRFDSRTILNEMGAEQLLGSGDMLFLENGANLVRLHGGYVSENEIENVVNYIKSQSVGETLMDITNQTNNAQKNELNFDEQLKAVDELYNKAVSIVVDQQKVSTSFIQRYLQIGYNRAARIVEQMEEDGIISEPSHAGKRSVLKK